VTKLKIIYSHPQEKYIFDKYKDAFAEYGEQLPNVDQPVDKDKAEQTSNDLIRVWEPKEVVFVKNLNWFYDCDFKIEQWTGYLIRSRICPYSPEEKFFAISLFKNTNEQLKTIGHELFHQPFHLHWEEECLEIFEDEEIVHCLKEALPELLNTPKFNLSKEKDIGWGDPCEKFIRHLIRKYYEKKGPFKFADFLKFIS